MAKKRKLKTPILFELPTKKRQSVLSVLGIDPGFDGGIAVVGENPIELLYARAMPVESIRLPNRATPKREIDVIRLEKVVREQKEINSPYIAALEVAGARPKQGVTSMFNFGQNFMAAKAAIKIVGLNYVPVMPAVWKGGLGLGAAKTESIIRAKTIFGNIPILDNDGVAEAALIAYYMITRLKPKKPLSVPPPSELDDLLS